MSSKSLKHVLLQFVDLAITYHLTKNKIFIFWMKQLENGLVEAVAVLISKMPRLRPDLPEEKLGECYNTKPEFMKVIYPLENVSED